MSNGNQPVDPAFGQETPEVQAAPPSTVCSYPKVPMIGPNGAQCWAAQVWPYQKSAPAFYASGGMCNARGDLAMPYTLLSVRYSKDQIVEMNRERAALCIPLLGNLPGEESYE